MNKLYGSMQHFMKRIQYDEYSEHLFEDFKVVALLIDL
jgi:hypothetical protein